MAGIAMPRFFDEPKSAWMSCEVVGAAPPEGFAVTVKIGEQSRSLIVSESQVRNLTSIPGAGEVRVTVVGRLPDGDPFGDGLLAELPSPPVDGSQRVRVRPDWLDSR